jgi:sulfopyruvate decarboxylase alpha subunit
MRSRDQLHDEILFYELINQLLTWLHSPTATEATMDAASNAPAWQQAVFKALKEGDIRQIAYVPDAGHAHAIRSAVADPDIEDVVLTTEEEGVAVVSGAWLGGQRAALLMQSSGVGNCVNMFSLLRSCNFPFLTLVTMRGEYAEFNPWQGPMGKTTQQALELMGITVLRADKPEDVGELVSAGLDAAFLAGEQVAVLLSQSLIGRKKWERN